MEVSTVHFHSTVICTHLFARGRKRERERERGRESERKNCQKVSLFPFKVSYLLFPRLTKWTHESTLKSEKYLGGKKFFFFFSPSLYFLSPCLFARRDAAEDAEEQRERERERALEKYVVEFCVKMNPCQEAIRALFAVSTKMRTRKLHQCIR